MVTATPPRPGRALARLSLRIYPVFRRLTKVQAAILLALLLAEIVVFGAMVGSSSWDHGASAHLPAVTDAGIMATGREAATEAAPSDAILFTSYTPAGAPRAAAGAEQVSLVEETVATGDAAR